jgi:ATP-dependent Clp protease ATP-binding subunit ClpC
LEAVQIHELCASDTCRILEGLRPSLTNHHGILVDAEVVQAAVERSISMEGLLPGKAIQLLDAAAPRARLSESKAVTLMDVYLTASRMARDRA